MNKFVPDKLRKAAELYEQRNAVYGDNYLRFGHIMAEMFPDGLTIKSPQDWSRIGVFVQIMSKITRYSANYDRGGHADSLLDNSVYSCMMAELDSELPEASQTLVCARCGAIVGNCLINGRVPGHSSNTESSCGGQGSRPISQRRYQYIYHMGSGE